MSDADEKKHGRLQDLFQEEAFLQVMADLQQNDEEQTTISDLIENVIEYSSSIYTICMKKEDQGS